MSHIHITYCIHLYWTLSKTQNYRSNYTYTVSFVSENAGYLLTPGLHVGNSLTLMPSYFKIHLGVEELLSENILWQTD